MVNATVVNSIVRYLEACREHGIDVSFGVVFGSQVQGTAHKWSDIDLLVVSPLFDRARVREEVNLLWRIASRVDNRIEPIACGERQWEHDDVSPIIEVARREGVRVEATQGAPAIRS
jgi:predicted nucleotidyltransferase